MGIEIERKYLVRDDSWRGQGESSRIVQGYLLRDAGRTVRVRIRNGRAWLTVKSRPKGLVRSEFEYEIPAADAEQLLALCEQPVLTKERHLVRHGAHLWEVDEYEGDLAGLVVAEVELSVADEEIDLPAWVGEEVSGDPRYANSNLVRWPLPDPPT